MDGVVLIDTDSLLGLVYSTVGQSYLKQASNLRVTRGVKEELVGLTRNPTVSVPAKKAQTCLRENPATDYNEPLTQSRTDQATGKHTKGEQSIHDYIIYGTDAVEVVLFFDDDMRSIMGRLSYPPPRFDVITAVFTYLSDQLSRKRMVVEAAKVASGRGWTSKRNLHDLFVGAGIQTTHQHEYEQVKRLCDKVTPDL